MAEVISMKINPKILVILNKIYQEILLRPVDEEGIKLYSEYIPYREGFVRKSLIASEEYRSIKTQDHRNIGSIKMPRSYTNTNIIQGKKFNYTNVNDSYKKNLLVLTLVKNCIFSQTINTIKSFHKDLQAIFKTVKFGIFTNNNQDHTPIELKSWQWQENNTKDIFIMENIDEPISVIEGGSCGNRIPKLAEYRNLLLKQSLRHYNTKFDYIIVFDSDIKFDTKNIADLIQKSISIDTEWSAISANNLFDKSNIHYDSLALRLPNEPVDITQVYPHFTKFYGKNFNWCNKAHIFDNFVEVKSAFGALTIYDGKELIDLVNNNANVYNVNGLPPCTCEHIPLDLKLKNKHYINGDMKISTNESMEGDLYGSPVLFLPRDAGFFSVFNFLIGTMSRGIRAYPYFNKEFFLQNRGSNQHFCYWTNNDNSWLDFFEPIKYYEKDTEHLDKTFLKYKLSSGEQAPEEFKTPAVFKNMLQNNTDELAEWRSSINGVYNHYIKFKSEILEKNQILCDKLFSNSEYIIGVHYRHPSHSVESGCLFLEQYFTEIDQILTKQPKAKIFLATDTEFGIMAFKHRYENKLTYIKDIKRLPIDNILEWAFALLNVGKSDGVGIIKNRGYELHQSNIYLNQNANYYELTANLLNEVLCLSKCNILINSTSNISLALSYINPNLQMITL